MLMGDIVHHRRTVSKRLSLVPIIDIERLKSDVSSKESYRYFRKVTDEWDEYMQHNKNNLQDAINQSTLNENQKDEMTNRIFIHEVFDISMADFNTRMNTARTVAEIKSAIETFRSKMLNAIESTGRKQMEKIPIFALSYLCSGRRLTLS